MRLKIFHLLVVWISSVCIIGSLASLPHNATTTAATAPQRNLRVTPRIVGGTQVPTGDYPFFGFWWGENCGCTLIHESVFLTAAHCVDLGGGPSNLGDIELHTTQQPNQFFVESITYHPQYNYDPGEPKWDFALLKLEGAVPASVATPVALNTDDSFLRSDAHKGPIFLTTMGYGATFEDSQAWSDTLQEVTTAYIPTFPQCLRAYDNAVIDAEVCAGNFFEGGKDACQGK